MLKIKISLFSFLLFLVFAGYGQDEELRVYPKNNQSVQEQQQDEKQCADYADQETRNGNHTTLKNSGIGAGIGLIGGKLLGKPLAGAAIGGAAGAYRGHKKSGQERDAFDHTYASCLHEKGYNLDIQPKGNNNRNNNNNNYNNDQRDRNNNNNDQQDHYYNNNNNDNRDPYYNNNNNNNQRDQYYNNNNNDQRDRNYNQQDY